MCVYFMNQRILHVAHTVGKLCTYGIYVYILHVPIHSTGRHSTSAVSTQPLHIWQTYICIMCTLYMCIHAPHRQALDISRCHGAIAWRAKESSRALAYGALLVFVCSSVCVCVCMIVCMCVYIYNIYIYITHNETSLRALAYGALLVYVCTKECVCVCMIVYIYICIIRL
jgi:hypothetical protein